jgi:hypothetical protein
MPPSACAEIAGKAKAAPILSPLRLPASCVALSGGHEGPLLPNFHFLIVPCPSLHDCVLCRRTERQISSSWLMAMVSCLLPCSGAVIIAGP